MQANLDLANRKIIAFLLNDTRIEKLCIRAMIDSRKDLYEKKKKFELKKVGKYMEMAFPNMDNYDTFEELL
jgi:hypothetical protein